MCKSLCHSEILVLSWRLCMFIYIFRELYVWVLTQHVWLFYLEKLYKIQACVCLNSALPNCQLFPAVCAPWQIGSLSGPRTCSRFMPGSSDRMWTSWSQNVCEGKVLVMLEEFFFFGGITTDLVSGVMSSGAGTSWWEGNALHCVTGLINHEINLSCLWKGGIPQRTLWLWESCLYFVTSR